MSATCSARVIWVKMVEGPTRVYINVTRWILRMNVSFLVLQYLFDTGSSILDGFVEIETFKQEYCRLGRCGEVEENFCLFYILTRWIALMSKR